MPIVVDPGYVWPPEVDPVVSPDGRLMAIVDPAHAGVLLRADFDDSVADVPAQPEKVLRRNLMPNPSFEVASPGWIISDGELFRTSNFASQMWNGGGAGALIAECRASGSAGYMILQATGSNYLSVKPGQWVAFAALLANDGLNNTGLRVEPYMEGTATTYHQPEVRQMAPFYAGRRALVSVQAPSTAQRAYFKVSMYSGASGTPIPAGKRMWVDSVMGAVADTKEEAEAQVATYFDGSTATSGEKRYRWAGTPHASISEEYTPATPFIPGHDATTAKVRFERQDGTVVRSGNPAWAPGGYAHAYDHEATLGGGTLWRAVPIRFDGSEGEPSEYVGAVIPALSDGWAWLKPVTDPDKAMLLKVEPPDLSYDGRVDTTSIAGAPRPAATWDVLEGFTTQLRSLVREKNVEQQLMALLDEGPVLAQFPACAGLPDFYFIRGKLDLEHVHWDGWPWRRYQWDVIQIDRPDTTDSPFRIPGLSYDTVARDWTTYDQLKSTVESYNKLLEP